MYKKLDVWKKSIELVNLIYDIDAKLPQQEKYGLGDQLRRASVSIPTNIAEGLTRNSNKEKKHFLNIARASTSEVETLIIISHQRKYIASIEKEAALINDVRSMIYRLEEKFSEIG